MRATSTTLFASMALSFVMLLGAPGFLQAQDSPAPGCNWLNFDGTNDYVSVAHAANLGSGTFSFAVSGWFNVGTSATNQVLISKRVMSDVVTGFPGYAVFLNTAGNLHAIIDDGTNFRDVETAVAYSDDAWHHMAVNFIRSGTDLTITIYVDGVLSISSGSLAFSTNTLNNTRPLTMGAGLNSLNVLQFPLSGRLDDFAYWRRTLTATQIADLYSGAVTPDDLTAQLRSYWPFEEGTGTTTADLSFPSPSTTNNVGTLTNGPLWEGTPDLVLVGPDPSICGGASFNLGDLIDGNPANGEVEDLSDMMNGGFLVYFDQPYIPENQQVDLMVSPSANTTYYFVKTILGGCFDELAVMLQVQGPVTINSISANEVICAGDDASFKVSATNAGDGALLYQWEVSADGGITWNPVSNDSIYSGATTDSLSITGATFAQNGYQYQVKVSTSACPVETSDARTLTVKPRPALQATINGVTVTDNYDGVDDTGSFTVCNSVPNNISINAFTDLNGVMAAGQVKVLQEVMLTNVAVPFCTGCVALLSSFTGAMGSATLVDPSMPGTLVLKLRAFYDDNNSNTLDAGDCAGDWVIYTITVGNIPNVSATADLPSGVGIYAACSGEDFTINIDSTGNPVGTTYSADWSLLALFGTPDLGLVMGTGDFANKPTTDSTSTTITGSFINPAPNVNSIQISLTITATTPDGCKSSYPLVIYLRPEISVTGITGLPDTVCSGAMTPVGNVDISLPSGPLSITWAWSGTDITATPPSGGPDNTDPFQVGSTTLLNNSGDPRTATLTVTPNLTYVTPAAQQCPGDPFPVTLSVEPGPLVSDQSKTICSDDPSGVTLGASTNLVAAATYNITAINSNGLTASAGGPVMGTGFLADSIANDAWTNKTNAYVDVVYTIVPVSAAGCVGPSFTVTLTIRPEPVVAFQSGMACSDDSIGIILGNADPFVSTYEIIAIDSDGLSASAGDADTTGVGFTNDAIADDAWTNTRDSNVNVVYTVVPISLDGCTGNLFTVTVTIKPEPDVADQTDMVCSDAPLGLSLGTGLNIAVDSFFISSVAVGDSLTAVQSTSGETTDDGAIAADSYTNLSSVTDTVVYTVTPYSADGCPGDPYTITVAVKPEPVVANQTATACSDANINVTLGDDVDGPFAVFYNVTGLSAMGLTPNLNNAVLPSSMFPVQFSSNTELNDQYTNLTNGPLDVIYTIVPLSDDGCKGDAFTVTVTISPEPVVANVLTINICSDQPIAYVLPATDDDGLAITKYDITASVDMGLDGTATEENGTMDINAIAGDIFTNLNDGGRPVVYTITPYAGDCAGAPFTVTFNIRAEPVLNPGLDKMVCSDEPLALTLSNDPTPGLGFPAISGYNLIAILPDMVMGLAPGMGNLDPLTLPLNNQVAGVLTAQTWTNTTPVTHNVIYQVAPLATNGCVGDTVDITIMIKPEPVINPVIAPAVCSDSPTGFTLPNDVDGPAAASYIITDITPNGLTASAGNPPTMMMLPTGTVTAAEIADDAWTNISGATVNVIYTVVPVSADGCKGNPFTVTVPIQAEPFVIAQTKTICSDEPVALLLGNSVLPPSVAFYQITAINNGGLIPGAGNVTPGNGLFNTAIQNDTWTNTTSGPVDVVYLVIPYGSNGCAGNLFSVTITVNPEPVVANQTKTVCSDEALALTLGNDMNGPSAATYNITAIAASGLTASAGAPAVANGLAANVIEDDAWTNTGTMPVEVVYTVVPVSALPDGCLGDPFTVTVTVNPEPVVAGQTDDACSDVAIGTILGASSSVAADTYTISSIDPNGLTPGMGNAVAGSGYNDDVIATDIWTNTTTDPVDVVYTVTPYADGCPGADFTITVTISPEPTFANVPTINVCSDEMLGYTLPTTSANGLPLTTFNISSVVQGGLFGTATTGTDFSDLTAIALDSFTNLTNGGLSVVYTVTPFSNGCQGADFTITFNIRAEPVLNPNLNTMVCSDAQIGVTLAIDNTTGFQTVTGYDLISVTPESGLVGAMSNAVSGTNLSASAIAADVWTNTTTDTLNVVYRVAPRRNFGCLGDTVDIIVMIKPEPVIADVTAPAVCSDSPTGFTFPNDVDGPAAATYNITDINTNGLTASAGLPAEANGLAASVIADDAWTNSSGATVNVIYTVVPVSADGCQGNPFTVTVPIQAEPFVIAQTKTICSDEPVALLLGNSVLPPSVSLYQITGIGNIAGLTPGTSNAMTGAGQLRDTIENDTWTNTGMIAEDIVYVIIPRGSNGCAGDPFSVTITVNPEPVVANQTKTVCSDEALALTLGNDMNGPSAATYNITAIAAGGLTASAGAPAVANGLAANVIEDDAWTNTGTMPVEVVYTVVPVSALPNGCQGDPFTVTVTVNPEPVVADQTDDACSDVAIGTILGASSSVAVDTYTISSIDPNGLIPGMGNAVAGSGYNDAVIATDIWTNTTTDPVDVVYTVVPVSADGCKGDPFTVAVTISPEPVVANQTAMTCSDVALNFDLDALVSGAGDTYTYTVVSSDPTNVPAGADRTVASNANITDTYTNTTSTDVTITYTVTPFGANECEGDEFDITVTVKPEPVVMDQTEMTCSDVALNFDLDALVSGAGDTYTYTVTSSDMMNVPAGADRAVASAANIMDTYTNTTGSDVTITYTVTPIGSNGCSGNTFTVTVTVKSEPVVINQAQSACSDVPNGLTLGASTNGTAADSYIITGILNNGMLATAGAPPSMFPTGSVMANEIADDAWRNVGLTPLDVVYTVVPVSAEGCLGNSFTVTITVSPEPVLNAPISPVALCSDELLSSAWSGIASTNAQTINFINVTSVTFSSMSPNFIPNPGNAAFPANAVPVGYFNNDSYTNLTGGGVTVSYTVVGVTPGGCASDPVVYQFQIRAEPVLNPDLDKTICSGGNTDLTLSLDPTIGFQTPNGFQITGIDAAAGLVGGMSNVPVNTILTSPYLLDDTWTNDTDGPLTVTYSIRPRRANGCFGDTAQVVVTVEPTPVASLVLTYNNQDETINADNHPSGNEYELTICSGENLVAVGATTVAPTPSRDLWVKVELNDPADALGLGAMPVFYAPLSQLAFDENIVNTTMAPYVISATITPFINFNGNQAIDAGECEGESFGLIITVNPEPVAVATPSDTELCDDGSFTVGLNTNGTSVAADQYKVTTTVSDPDLTQTMGDATIGGTVMLAGPMSMINGTFSNATTSTQTVTYSIVPISADGCEGKADTVTVNVWARPSAAPTPEAICRGTIATIDPGVTLGSAAIMSYKWTYIGTTASNFRINPGGGLLNPNSPTGAMFTTTTLSINTVSPLATTGLIGFELVVTDENGCTSEPVEVYIEVKNVPNPGTNGSFGPVCETFGNVNLTSLLGGSPQTGGTWTAGMSNPVGGTLIGPNFNPAGSVGGTYMFTYTIDNGACPPQSATVTVIVQPNANAGTFDITADNDVCAGEPSFNLFDLLNANSYDLGGSWSELSSSGAVLNAATGALDLSTALPGNYTFRYTVTVGPTACPNPTDFEEVTLNIIAPPAANPILGNVMPCINSMANYALTTPNTPGVTYAWSLSGGGTITSPLDSNAAVVNWGNTPGTYTLTLTEMRLGCETVNELMVEVKEIVADFTFVIGSQDGLTINFTDASTGGVAVWLWNFGDGNTSSDQNPTHVYAAPGQYTVCLDVIGACGSDQVCKTVNAVGQIICDQIVLNAGINLISFDVIPTSTSVEDVFVTPLGNNLLSIQGRNSTGQATIYIPGFALNTLTDVAPGEGYYVRVLTATNLEVCGTPIDPDFKKNLTAGINLVAYIPVAPSTPAVYFGDLIANNNFLSAVGYDPGFRFFVIGNPLNTLNTVRNSRGYEVRVLNPTLGTNWLLGNENVEYRNMNEIVPTNVYDFVAASSDLPASAVGDQVEIIDDKGKIVGYLPIIEGGYLMTTPIYGHDTQYEPAKGIDVGMPLRLRYKGRIVETGLTFTGRYQLHFIHVSFGFETESVATVITQATIAPNPFIGQLFVKVELANATRASVEILDANGRLVKVLQVQTDFTAGTHNFQWEAMGEAAGLYYVVIRPEGETAIALPAILQR